MQCMQYTIHKTTHRQIYTTEELLLFLSYSSFLFFLGGQTGDECISMFREEKTDSLVCNVAEEERLETNIELVQLAVFLLPSSPFIQISLVQCSAFCCRPHTLFLFVSLSPSHTRTRASFQKKRRHPTHDHKNGEECTYHQQGGIHLFAFFVCGQRLNVLAWDFCAFKPRLICRQACTCSFIFSLEKSSIYPQRLEALVYKVITLYA